MAIDTFRLDRFGRLMDSADSALEERHLGSVDAQW